MSTKFFSDGEVHSYFNPYDTPYDAFINYMNVLSDFEIRVNASVRSAADDQVARLSKIIQEKDEQLEKLEKRLTIETSDDAVKAPAKKAASTRKKAPAKKAPATTKKKSSTTRKS
jgi:alpha-amylase